jgi:AAA15 family ATPase/GTPase
VILDEADSGIHDILFKKILQDIRPYIRGQIIMTSHNTVLMESEFAHSATYFMDELENGKKVIRSVSDYEKRTFQANNIRSKYLNDEYGGMPSVKDINFEAVLQEVEKYIE